jgi:cell division protein FtsZ
VIAAGFDEPSAGRARPRALTYGAALPSAELAARAAAPGSPGAGSDGSRPADAAARTGSGPAGTSDWRPFQLGEPTADRSSAGGAARPDAGDIRAGDILAGDLGAASDRAESAGSGAGTANSGTGGSSTRASGTNGAATSGANGADADVESGIPAPRSSGEASESGSSLDGEQAGSRPDSGRPEPASTRRKSVVFEEDDELDVPDFLK